MSVRIPRVTPVNLVAKGGGSAVATSRRPDRSQAEERERLRDEN